MFCENCGCKLEKEDRFCPNCGSKIDWEETGRNGKGDETVNETRKDSIPMDRPSSNKKYIVIAVCAAVVILANVIFLSINYFSGRTESSGETEMAASVSTGEDMVMSGAETDTEKEFDADADTIEETEEIAEEEDADTAKSVSRDTVFDGAVLYRDSVDVNTNTYSEISVVAASATSTISQENTDNGPMTLFDGRDDTSWQEGKDGYGIGESLTFRFNGDHTVKYIAFKLGNWRNTSYFQKNGVPKTLTISIGDFETQVTFTGEQKVEWVELTEDASADQMKIYIDEVYEGTDWDDTCITEITLYGE